jgi:serine/threonine-protein kinase
MATVHFGRLAGPAGFSRAVAIKRMYPQFARDAEFVAMFLDEARLAACIHHPNVVSTLDIVSTPGELFQVMEYVRGATLEQLVRRGAEERAAVPPPIAVSIFIDLLRGLHAAHEACTQAGNHAGIVHRDVSPQNVLVGVDGVARVLDFGVAKAVGRMQTTQGGRLKGKLAYMAPEQLEGKGVTPRTDIYAAAVVLWEALTGRRLFTDEKGDVLGQVLTAKVVAPSEIAPVPPAFDAVVMRGLDRDPLRRYGTALEMAEGLFRCLPGAQRDEVGSWVWSIARGEIENLEWRVSRAEAAGGSPGTRELQDTLRVTDEASRTNATGAALSSNVQPRGSRQGRRVGIVLGSLAILGVAGLVLGLPRAGRVALPETGGQTSLSPASANAPSPINGAPEGSGRPEQIVQSPPSPSPASSAPSALPPATTSPGAPMSTTHRGVPRRPVSAAPVSPAAAGPAPATPATPGGDPCKIVWKADASGILHPTRECP